MSSEPVKVPEWEYSGVKLTLHNVIIPEDKLYPSPSSLDNLDEESEQALRFLGCELIQDAGLLLKLPQVVMATAQVLYQRFYYSKSFVRNNYEHFSMACLFLAAKIEEDPRRLRDIINVYHHIRQIREQKLFTPVVLDADYLNKKNIVIKAERRVLKELGFCVHGKHPHKLIISYLQNLRQHNNKNLVQISWNYMNDCLRTDAFVRYYPETIACACIFLAARQLGIALPNNPGWWEMYNVGEMSMRSISLQLLRMYARPRPDVTALEARLAELLAESRATRLRPGSTTDKDNKIVEDPNGPSSTVVAAAGSTEAFPTGIDEVGPTLEGKSSTVHTVAAEEEVVKKSRLVHAATSSGTLSNVERPLKIPTAASFSHKHKDRDVVGSHSGVLHSDDNHNVDKAYHRKKTSSRKHSRRSTSRSPEDSHKQKRSSRAHRESSRHGGGEMGSSRHGKNYRSTQHKESHGSRSRSSSRHRPRVGGHGHRSRDAVAGHGKSSSSSSRSSSSSTSSPGHSRRKHSHSRHHNGVHRVNSYKSKKG